MKKVTMVICMFLISLIFAVNAFANDLSSDDFESYTVGTFPSSGGWQLLYNGAGTPSQYVDNTHSTSGAKSLHLVGSSCWSAEAYLPISLSSRVKFETMVMIDQIVSCGCTPSVAYVTLFDPTLNTWGTGYGGVDFNCDGKVYAMRDHYDRSKDIFLMSYNAVKWYHVEVVADLTLKTFDVYIDGVLLKSGLEMLDAGSPKGIKVVAGHGSNPTAWFDDVKVSIPTSCSQTDFDTAYQAGRQACITNPASCGIPTSGGNQCGTVTYNLFTPTVHYPCLNIEGTSYWLDLGIYSNSPTLLLNITNFGTN